MSKEKPAISAKKILIFQKAAQLFQEKGYLASSMREIATRVGIEASSLYSHISSKEEILHKICFETAHVYAETWQKIRLTNNSSIQQIEKLIEFHVDMAWDNPVSVTVFNDEWRNLKSEDQTKFLKLRKDYEYSILSAIQKGISNKEIVNLDPHILSHSIINGLRWTHFVDHKGYHKSKKQVQQDLKALFLHGICKDQ